MILKTRVQQVVWNNEPEFKSFVSLFKSAYYFSQQIFKNNHSQLTAL